METNLKSNIILTFFIIIFIHCTYCEFLEFPLRKLKKYNLNLDYNNKDFQKYFDPNITLTDFLINFYYRTFYSEVEVGYPKQKIKFEFSGAENSLNNIVNSKYRVTNNINYFNRSSSITNLTYMYDFIEYYVLLTGTAEDDFYFNIVSNDKNTEKKIHLPYFINEYFFDIMADKYEYDIKQANQTFNFVAGLLKDGSKLSFLIKLKEADILPSYDFSYDFHKSYKIDPNTEDDHIGNLVFGKFEQLYNDKKYPQKYLKKTKLLPSNSTYINYIIYLDKIYSKGEKELDLSVNVKLEITFDYDFFVANYEFKEYIDYLFFKKVGEICQEKSIESKFYDAKNPIKTYRMYVCDKEVLDHKNIFPKIVLQSKDFNYDFEFDFDELFKQHFNKVYFLIMFQKLDLKWRVGEIFLKKYKLYFNIDTNLAYFYNENENKTSGGSGKVVKIVIIVILIALIFISGIYFGKKIRAQRKIRANELEDNYEYLMVSKDNI